MNVGNICNNYSHWLTVQELQASEPKSIMICNYVSCVDLAISMMARARTHTLFEMLHSRSSWEVTKFLKRRIACRLCDFGAIVVIIFECTNVVRCWFHCSHELSCVFNLKSNPNHRINSDTIFITSLPFQSIELQDIAWDLFIDAEADQKKALQYFLQPAP